MRIALISPYHGGSHKHWADGLIKYSQHEIFLFRLPARFWKWRMHGGAVTLAREFIASSELFDLILCTDMLDLSTFLALTRKNSSSVPTVLYMHENQLTYPLPKNPNTGPMRRQKGERDLHYAFINYSSMLAADHVLFNSNYHRDELLSTLPVFLKSFPEFNELNTINELANKSSVFPIGIDLPHQSDGDPAVDSKSAPLIIWNQRWEFDKNPKEMLEVLYTLQDRGFEFELALCGQNFRTVPVEFEQALEMLSDRIVHYGYAKREKYHRLLMAADITFSTAIHEYFGISVLEAMASETYPLLPNRLCYPEILPLQFHDYCLYNDTEHLLTKMAWVLTNQNSAREISVKLAQSLQNYRWTALAPGFDLLMEGFAAAR